MTRYVPLLKIASGGTAAVWVGTAEGAHGFRQVVAIKKPHPNVAEDAAFRAELVREAKIAARIHHANVVDVRDVIAEGEGVELVMEYVEGAALGDLIRGWLAEPPARAASVAIRIVLDACEGLRAVHDLVGDDGATLGLVHRDVSPANVLVGTDGVARIADFGLAKPLLAVDQAPTAEGVARGKVGYMAPEYLGGKKGIDKRVDVFAMGVVLWEVLARKRLFRGDSEAESLEKVLRMHAPPLPRTDLGEAAAALDAVIARATDKDPRSRYASIEELANELSRVASAHDLVATHADVREAFPSALRRTLDERRRQVSEALARAPSEAVAAPLPRRSRRVELVAVALVLIAGAATAFLLMRDGDPARRAIAEPRVIAPDVQRRADETRSRAPSVESAEASSASAPGPRPDKWPRPNPYPREAR